jgi:hypothetical protein
MSNSLISHGGGVPEGYDVVSTGTKIAGRQKLRKYLAITNTSDTPIYLALNNSTDGVTCTAVVGKGIYLAPEGGSFELNNVNMYYDEIWAIHSGASAKRVCVQGGR